MSYRGGILPPRLIKRVFINTQLLKGNVSSISFLYLQNNTLKHVFSLFLCSDYKNFFYFFSLCMIIRAPILPELLFEL